MASPVYNTAAYRRRHYGSGRWWDVVTGGGSMLGGNTPEYLGAGQPAIEDSGWLFGDGTPIYQSAPDSTTSPSVMPSAATAPLSDPLSGQIAIVVPRS